MAMPERRGPQVLNDPAIQGPPAAWPRRPRVHVHAGTSPPTPPAADSPSQGRPGAHMGALAARAAGAAPLVDGLDDDDEAAGEPAAGLHLQEALARVQRVRRRGPGLDADEALVALRPQHHDLVRRAPLEDAHRP